MLADTKEPYMTLHCCLLPTVHNELLISLDGLGREFPIKTS